MQPDNLHDNDNRRRLSREDFLRGIEKVSQRWPKVIRPRKGRPFRASTAQHVLLVVWKHYNWKSFVIAMPVAYGTARPMHGTDLARETGLDPSTINTILRWLTDEKHLLKTVRGHGHTGATTRMFNVATFRRLLQKSEWESGMAAGGSGTRRKHGVPKSERESGMAQGESGMAHGIAAQSSKHEKEEEEGVLGNPGRTKPIPWEEGGTGPADPDEALLALFLSTRTEAWPGRNIGVGANDLEPRYEEFCQEHGRPPLDRQTLRRLITARGFRFNKDWGREVYDGLSIRQVSA